MYHLITTSQGCHNGASMVINRAHLPPQESLFTLCHHSRPSLPQNLMVSEVPFIPLSLRLCVPFPIWKPKLEDGPVSGALGLTSAPLQWRLLQLCFGALSPLPRQIRPQAGHGEREPLGVSLSSHSQHRQVAQSGH